MKITLRTACLLALCLSVTRGAERIGIDLDSGKTKIGFTVSDVLHTVHGTFQLKEGHLSFDPSTRAMAGDLVVDAASGNSDSVTRDKRMTRNILEAQRYPEVRFTPSAYTGSVVVSGVSNVQVTGSLLIHGQAHKITIPMQVQRAEQEISATGKFTVPYVQWGMKDPSNFLLKVNKEVEIDLKAVGHMGASRVP